MCVLYEGDGENNISDEEFERQLEEASMIAEQEREEKPNLKLQTKLQRARRGSNRAARLGVILMPMAMR
ncbi:hypothetical protein DPMN_072381 [Dreissena polymorpha]|uniref:Uncharacterized protein n=1 Tax=Dreissena polymorpha TaxID=45954 RepID=A0A9D3Z647_DREPO|nr:hypothetical protein DPMN_072381 [Dreissena polymorpha]